MTRKKPNRAPKGLPPIIYPLPHERWIGLDDMLSPAELEELRRKDREDIIILKKAFPGLKTTEDPPNPKVTKKKK